jgi:hypothetical protein
MQWIEWSREKKLVITTIVLIILLVEVYAHNYVTINELSVVPDSQAKAERGGTCWHL